MPEQGEFRNTLQMVDLTDRSESLIYAGSRANPAGRRTGDRREMMGNVAVPTESFDLFRDDLGIPHVRAASETALATARAG